MINKDKELLLLSIFTFLTVSMWIFFELTKTTKTTTVERNVTQVLTPFDPKIETELLDILENKQN